MTEVILKDRLDGQTILVEVKWVDAATNEWLAVFVRAAANLDEVNSPQTHTRHSFSRNRRRS